MASLNTSINIPTRLSQSEAIDRIRHLLTKVQKEHAEDIKDVRESWKGNVCNFSFKAKGYDVSGTMRVLLHTISLDGKVPFFLGFFKGKIIQTIQDQATLLFAA